MGYENIPSITALYLIFNVALPTWIRIMDKDAFSKKDYLLTLIPLYGEAYGLSLIIRNALSD